MVGCWAAFGPSASASGGDVLTKDDTRNLWKLLEIFRPGDKHLKNSQLLSAWALVLEPYKPEDVRSAVVQYFRTSSFWPDVTDIARLCPQPDAEERAADHSAKWTPKDIQRSAEWMDAALEMGELMRRDYISAGIPHPAQARRMGWSAEEWNRRCREATGG